MQRISTPRASRLIGVTCLALALSACSQAAAPPDEGSSGAAPSRGAAHDAGQPASEHPERAGRYVLRGAHAADLELAPAAAGAHWEVVLRGGGAAADGAAVAADCELHARGPLRDDRIDADVVPFEGELMSVTAEDLKRAPASVTVRFDGPSVVVQTDAALCGNGADFNGRYQRSQQLQHAG
ncbi:hypothetical protein ABE488_11745 [Luteimonas sp. TWI662]|uniref:hypothetical protein n=1 Tax=Luteimonas sp. TWI662 TaxID=3136789 RepID=UPI0032099A88